MRKKEEERDTVVSFCMNAGDDLPDWDERVSQKETRQDREEK